MSQFISAVRVQHRQSSAAELLVELKQRAGCCIDEAGAKLHSLSQDITSHPEFFSQEKGWKVDSHFKLETAFGATWQPAGSERGDVVNVGFLCEYDALPGVGHACGHNIIAEEDGGGKIDMLREGAFDGLDVVFMAHPSKEDATYLPCVAEHDVTVKYHGKGINALDAAVLCYNNLSVLRQQMKPDWRVHGIIKHNGVKPNIIPAYTELEYYLRTPSRSELPVLNAKAERCFQSAALATGCEVRKHVRLNVITELYERNRKALGMDFTTEEDILSNESGSTDFGNVTFVVPGIHPYLYIGSNAINHTEEYTVAAGVTAKALAMTVLDVLLCPELLQRVKQEFIEAKLKEDRRLTGEHTDSCC
uniref:Peptidase M20 domain-containing protein 2 n=1 Tax=Seriola dumerili TaxID=41447 RepID=A0A3B4T6C6_SERDU